MHIWLLISDSSFIIKFMAYVRLLFSFELVIPQTRKLHASDIQQSKTVRRSFQSICGRWRGRRLWWAVSRDGMRQAAGGCRRWWRTARRCPCFGGHKGYSTNSVLVGMFVEYKLARSPDLASEVSQVSSCAGRAKRAPAQKMTAVHFS